MLTVGDTGASGGGFCFSHWKEDHSSQTHLSKGTRLLSSHPSSATLVSLLHRSQGCRIDTGGHGHCRVFLGGGVA